MLSPYIRKSHTCGQQDNISVFAVGGWRRHKKVKDLECIKTYKVKSMVFLYPSAIIFIHKNMVTWHGSTDLARMWLLLTSLTMGYDNTVQQYIKGLRLPTCVISKTLAVATQGWGHALSSMASYHPIQKLSKTKSKVAQHYSFLANSL